MVVLQNLAIVFYFDKQIFRVVLQETMKITIVWLVTYYPNMISFVQVDAEDRPAPTPAMRVISMINGGVGLADARVGCHFLKICALCKEVFDIL